MKRPQNSTKLALFRKVAQNDRGPRRPIAYQDTDDQCNKQNPQDFYKDKG